MKNSLFDLSLHLFEQLERISDTDLKEEALKEEIKRANAIVNISSTIIENANLALKVEKFRSEAIGESYIPQLLEGGYKVVGENE